MNPRVIFVSLSGLEMWPAMPQVGGGFPVMKNLPAWSWGFLAWAFTAAAPAQPQPANHLPVVTYSLLEGSYFVDDCLICC